VVAIDAVLADLKAEGDELEAMVAGLDEAGWRTGTPAEGWSIAHQIAHLAWTDRMAQLAATDPAQFAKTLEIALRDAEGFVDAGAVETLDETRGQPLEAWRESRKALSKALTELPPGQKVAWFGPPMSAPSMATARIMETWAHAQDVADTLGITRVPTARLRNVAHLGVRTRDWAYHIRGLTPPAEEFRVELTGPDGTPWTWGPVDAEQSVVGSALDFCFIVTQRRHRDDLDVVATGVDAEHWLTIAQSFAGPPGRGREKGQFG